jgi:hypothetical protein
MKMKKILIALASVAFLAGCSADGTLGPNSTLETPYIQWSNNETPSGGGTINCLISSTVCLQLTQSACLTAGGTPVNSCPSNPNPPPSNAQYCYYSYGDCDLIGGSFTSSLTSCSNNGGIPATLQYCYDHAEWIEGIGWL